MFLGVVILTLIILLAITSARVPFWRVALERMLIVGVTLWFGGALVLAATSKKPVTNEDVIVIFAIPVVFVGLTVVLQWIFAPVWHRRREPLLGTRIWSAIFPRPAP